MAARVVCAMIEANRIQISLLSCCHVPGQCMSSLGRRVESSSDKDGGGPIMSGADTIREWEEA